MKTTQLFSLFLTFVLLLVSCADEVDNVENELEKAPKLTFTKLTINKKDVSKDELLKQIKEKEKEGFTIKNITISNDSFADIDKTNFSLTLKKAGTFTIKLILQKKGFEDAVIEATIEYLLSETLNFNKFTTFKSTITKTDILNAVTGKKDGFTIKSITLEDKYKPFADVKGTAPELSLTLKKAGDFTASIVLQKSNHTDVTLTASFSGVPQKLTFNKLITFKTTITKTELLAQIPEKEKAGYNLKNITLENKYKSFADVKGTAPNLSLNLKKIGDFKAAITLSKTDYLDVAITGAAFKFISKNLAFPNLKTFKQTLTKNDILTQIQGDKTGYAITKIEVSDSNFATVNPTTNTLTLKKDGPFTITITLGKTGVTDVKINGQIEYRPIPTLTFTKLTTAKKTLTKAEIETQIKGTKNGYTLKNIVVDDTNFATVDNSNFSLSLKKEGIFTATITMGKTDYFDVTFKASFEGKAETLTFTRLSTYKKTIPKANILKRVQGANGYTLKSIVINQSGFAKVGGDLSLTLKKEGDFTAKITLQKTDYFDAVINPANFKATSEALSFTKLKTHKNTLLKSDIFTHVDGNKTSYTITKIEVSNSSFATVNPTTNTLTLKKDGPFTIKITLQKTGYPEVKIIGQIEYKPKPALTFTKLTTAKKTLTKAEIIDKINGTKNGYTLKNIVVDDTNFATVDNSNFSLNLIKEGSFTATITMGKTDYFDVTFKASFEGKAETFTFTNLTTAYSASLTNSAILAQLQGSEKANYTLKSISNISDNFVAEVQGSGANSSIDLKKAGAFTATIVLERSGYFDVTIPAATFIITKAAAKTLSFSKLTTNYKETLSNAAILKQVVGTKTGYTLKSISDIKPNTIAELTGTPKLSLHLKKPGSFTATLVLEHPTLQDVTINNAGFEISKLPAKNLSFNQLTISYKNTITKADLFDRITGSKIGYSIQSVSAPNPNDIAELSGLVDIKVKKAGSFIANIILAHAFYGNSTVQANFTINKLPTPANLNFTGLTSTFKNTLTEKDILNNVTGDKKGYTLKNISNISANNIAELSGTVVIKIKKAGSFTADVVLEHPFYKDKTFTGKTFTIKSYSFDKLTTAYKKTITKVEIEGQVQALTGYTLKSITGINPADIAEVTGATKTSIQLKKAGSFTANLIMEKSEETDAIINHAEFEITELPAKKLTFKRLTISSKTLLAEKDLLARIPEVDKNGYTLKSITGIQVLSGSANLVEITGSPVPSIKINEISGIFTVDITLEHPLYLDVTLTGATFEKKEQIFIFDENTKTITGVTTYGKTYFATATEVTFPDQIDGTDVEKIKERDISSPSLNVFGSNDTNPNITIKTIHLPKNLKTIGGYAFFYCRSLTSINIPESVTSIGNNVFYGCWALTSITLPKSLTTIGNSAFSDCISLTSINIPDKVTSIGEEAFSYCYDLLSITLPNSVTSIGSWAFTGCTSLTSINIPDKVTTIGNGAFSNCRALTSINIPESVTTIGYKVFEDSDKVIVTIKQADPTKITSVGADAFDSVKKIRVPKNSLQAYKTANIWKKWKDKMEGYSIKKLAFKKLTTYKAVISQEDIIAQITELSGVALSGNGYTIKSISNLKALSGSAELSGVELLGASTIKISKQVISFTADIVLQHPLYLDMPITGASFEKEKAFVFDTSTKTITGVTAKYKTYFARATEVTFPDQINGVNVEEIKGSTDLNVFGAVGSKTIIKTIHLPKNLKTIGNNAFYKCLSLTSITLPESVTTIGREAFSFCYFLTPVNIPKSVTSIGESAFSFCYSLTSVNIPKSVTTIGRGTFSYCIRLTSVNIPKSVTTIGGEAFLNCTKAIVTIKQPDHTKITTVAADAFDDVKKIRVHKNSLQAYKTANIWKEWEDKMEGYSIKKLAFKKLSTHKTVITPENIIAQVTELSGVALSGNGYTIKSISNLKALSGSAKLSGVELSGISTIKISKQTISFTADIVLQHPFYLDMPITGASFEKFALFVFDTSTKTITGVTAQYKTYFSTATEVTFPDQIDGVDVEAITGGPGANVFGSSPTNNSIKTIHLPKKLKTIGELAFSDVRALTSITLPETVISIEDFAFSNCTNAVVTIKQTDPTKITKVAANVFDSVTQIKVPSASLKNYQTAGIWQVWDGKIVGY